MSRFLKLAALLLVPACVDAPSTSTSSSNIVGGVTAHTADYKTVVALENGPGQWFCTGTLIAPEWILTAAQCVEACSRFGRGALCRSKPPRHSGGDTLAALELLRANPARALRPDRGAPGR